MDKLTGIESLDELEKLTPREREIFERLAALEHARWAGWQRHLHGKCMQDGKGNLVIPANYVEHLERQIKTDYSGLTEGEKDSDRAEVLKTWRIIAEIFDL
ncbi:MAG TPA: hypothetical protein P5080_00015 [Candidatus Paceibacterota bacterium]|nr:hypothetical protein [Candidatus Pacearchaeota archaeon]HRZ50358.1 hypothetical protein [Candidatus Paceibacterota bacterium]HSA36079.1 hypothetical protein [Candidatus Paceibacterota bacterium]